ncbi:MAG: SDR family oxidoreductase [Bacteroidota bacterium]
MNIIITGATKGIGRAIAERFAKEGFNLAICARTTKDLNALKKDFKAKYPEVEVLTKKTDMSKKQQVLDFAKFIKKHWKQVDILVNNAGLFLGGEVHQHRSGLLEKLIETNLYSAVYMSKAIVPMMLKQKAGHIFNMCSVASLVTLPNCGLYCTSKFAMYGFSKCLRDELKDKGVRVSTLLPGATMSNAWDGSGVPENRLMQAADVAEAIWSAYQMSGSTVIEEIILRPQLGDL